MKIDQVTLKDFRQYEGEQKIDFSENGLTIIKGSNGAGKTNLFEALQWCMYGQSTLDETENLPLLNESTLSDLEVNQTTTVKVSLKLSNANEQWQINREGQVKKGREQKSSLKYEDFYVMEKTSSGWVSLDQEEAEATVNKILPQKIRQFYFFDGEKLDRYFRMNTASQVRDTVKDVSQIGLLERTLKHVSNTANKVSKKFKGDVGDKISNLTDQIEDKDSELEEIREELKSKNEAIESKREQVNKIDQKLRNTNKQEVDDLQKRREKIQETLNVLNKKRDNLRREVEEKTFDHSIKCLIPDAIEKAREVIDKKEEEVGLPPNIRATFVKALLDSEECICGRTLEEKHKDNLREIADEESVDGISTLAIDGKYKLEEAASEINKFEKNSSKLMEEIDSVGKEIREKEKRVEDISQKLKGMASSDTKVPKLEKKRAELNKQIDELNSKKGHLKHKLDVTSEERKKLVKERGKLRRKDSKQTELDNKVDSLERGQELLEEVREDILKEIKSAVEQRTEQQFFELIWKESFREVQITDDFEVRVLNEHGRNAINNLSAGERQALALSFMAALKQVSGYDFPVIIDTPLGRISEEPRLNIAENLPRYLEDTQLTLLVTNTEYDSSFREMIEDEVGVEYTLDFDDDENVTEVVQG